MLYSVYEAQHQWLQPMRLAVDAYRSVLVNPFNPFARSSLSRTVAAGSDLFLRVTQRYAKPEWNIDTVEIDGKAIPVSVDTEIEKPFCRLLRFRRDFAAVGEPERRGPRILLVAPLSGHHATLLRDTVRAN